MRIGMLKRMV